MSRPNDRPLARLLAALIAMATLSACSDGPGPAAPFEETKQADATPDEDAATPDGADAEPDAADAPAVPDVPPTPDAVRDTVFPEPDAEADPGPEPPGPFDPDPEPVEPDVLACDAGHAAWAARALVAVYGRRPLGSAEVRVWARLAEQAGRAVALDAMMRSPEYVDRWFDFLLDALRVNRVGDKKQDTCYGGPVKGDDPPDEPGQLAAFVRDAPPIGGGSAGAFNMTDLVRSALRLDDLSPVYRGHLFAMLSKPLTGANVDDLEMEITRRRDFGEVFEAAYLHRNATCTVCHNSTFSVTGHADPELDRTWEIPGHFETALFETPAGRPAEEVHAMLRRMGVGTDSIAAARPWGWAPVCGRIVKPENIKPDPVGTDAFFIEAHGAYGSVWQLEGALAAGFEGLRQDGLDRDPVTLAVPGPEAFAYLVSVNLANQVWTEIMGHPLTIANYFPRNRGQRDALWLATERFVEQGFSLRALIRHAVLDPRFNQLDPEAGCGADDGYYMRPTFDPWTVHEDDPARQGNGAGDLLVRLPARTLLRTMVAALGWPAPSRWPSGAEETLHVAIGAFTKDAEPGFRGVDFQGLLAWEDAHGVCSQPMLGELTGPGCTPTDKKGCGGCSCQACVCDLDPYCCDTAWDGQCVTECEEDCGGCDVETVPEPVEDFVARLLAAADGDAGLRLEEVVVALKDRLLQAPDIAPDEAPLLEALLGAPLATPVGEVPELDARLRVLCGLLAQTPQFLLSAAPEATDAAGPELVLPGESLADHCERVRPLWDADTWYLSCGDADVLLLPPLPAKPNPTPPDEQALP